MRRSYFSELVPLLRYFTNFQDESASAGQSSDSMKAPLPANVGFVAGQTGLSTDVLQLGLCGSARNSHHILTF